MSAHILFDELLEQNGNNKIQWRIENSTKYSGLIFQKNSVYRLFEGLMPLDDDSNLTVLVVLKKMDDPEWDYAVEKHHIEIKFIADGELVFELDEDDVQYRLLINLIHDIEGKTNNIKSIIEKIQKRKDSSKE